MLALGEVMFREAAISTHVRLMAGMSLLAAVAMAARLAVRRRTAFAVRASTMLCIRSIDIGQEKTVDDRASAR